MPEGLQFGYPVRSDGQSWSVVEGIEHDDFAQGKIDVTTEELVDERDEVRSLGLIGELTSVSAGRWRSRDDRRHQRVSSC